MTVEQIREALRPAIEAATQAAVARRTGVPQPTISAWLAGRRRMTLEDVCEMADAVGHPLTVTPAPGSRPGNRRKKSAKKSSKSRKRG